MRRILVCEYALTVLAAAGTLALKCGAVSFCLRSGTVVVHIDVLGYALAAVLIVGAIRNIAADCLIGCSLFGSCHFDTLL